MSSPISPQAVEAEVANMANAGEWQALCDRVLAIHATGAPAMVRPRVWLYLVTAALEAGSAPALQAAIDAGSGPVLPREIRAELARRLAAGGQGPAALGVLLFDDTLLGYPPLQSKCVAALNDMVAQRQDAGLRKRARALRDGLLSRRVAPPPAAEAAWRFVEAPYVAPVAPPLAIFNAEAIPAADLAEIRARDQAFERALRAPPPPRIRQYDDVFVNRQGQIWRADGTVLHDAGRVLPAASLAAQPASRSIPEAVAALETAGFYHWFAEWLPSLFWTLQAPAAGLPYLLHDRAPGYQRESLAMLRQAPFAVETVGDALRVGRLYVADRTTACLAHDGAYRAGFAALAAQAPRGTAERIYISRRDGTRRPLLNEAWLEDQLERRGFRILRMADLPLPEQIGQVQGAAVVVAPHGAGLVHLLGPRRGIAVFELMPVLTKSIAIRHCIARISRLRGHRHAMHVVRPNVLTHEWSVDVAQVVDQVQRFAEGAA